MAKVQENRRNILRGSLGSSLATLLSRFLGLFRVVLEARVLGGDAMASSWQLAFMIPNLFRRLLGEGALAQALIPILSHVEAEKGEEEVRRQLAVVLCFLSGLLGAIVIVTAGLAMVIRPLVKVTYIAEALRILPLLMPYAIFICLVGVMTAVASMRRIFFRASLNALILNIVLISVLYFGQKIALRDPKDFLDVLAVSVLVSGILQLLMLVYLLKQGRIFPIFQRASASAKSIIKKLFTKAFPGIVGSAADQICFLVDRGLACTLGAFAVPALHYTERLVYLPIGIVAIALNSVLMADMSRAAANKNFDELMDDMRLGLRYVWFLCAPLAIFFIVYQEPVLRFFFMRGNFTANNVQQTAEALSFYALGIPAFCAWKVITPAFHARLDMKTPFYVSLATIAVNIGLSVLLMRFFRQGGIALASAAAALLGNVLLLAGLRKAGFELKLTAVFATMIKSVLAGTAAASPIIFYDLLNRNLEPLRVSFLPDDTLPLLLCGVAFLIIYLGLMSILRAKEPAELIGSIAGK